MWLSRIGFDWLFLQCSESTLGEDTTQKLLTQALFATSATVAEVKRAVCLIIHRLAQSGGRDAASRDLLLLLASIMQGSQSTLSPPDSAILKEFVFHQSVTVKELCLKSTLSDVIRKGMLFHGVYLLL